MRVLVTFSAATRESEMEQKEERGGRERETASEEEKPSAGKTMIGRRSLETCLPGPGKCTTRGPRFTRRQTEISGEMGAAARSFY